MPEVRLSQYRGVGFLVGDHRELDAWDEFGKLKDNQRRRVLASASHWIDTGLDSPDRNHGFRSDSQFTHAYVFKLQNKRFYGFLFHPQPNTNARLQVCVLCSHALKNTFQTDRGELAQVYGWLNNPAALDAIRQEFPDKPQPPSANKGRVVQWKTFTK